MYTVEVDIPEKWTDYVLPNVRLYRVQDSIQEMSTGYERQQLSTARMVARRRSGCGGGGTMEANTGVLYHSRAS